MSWLSWDVNLKVRLIGETLFSIFLWMFLPFMALFFSETFGKSTAGVLLIIPPLLSVVISLIGGRISDKLGRRPVMLFSVAFEVLMFLLFFLSSSPWMMYLAFVGLNLSASLYQPASEAMIADLTNEEDRNFVFAMFYTAMNLGVVIGPLLGAFFFVNYRNELMLACMIVTAILFVVYFFVLKETKPSAPQTSSDVVDSAPSWKKEWQSFQVIFRDKVFSLYLLAGVFVFIAFSQMDLYMAIYIKEHVLHQPLIWWGDWTYSLGGTSFFGWMMALNGFMVVTLTAAMTRWISAWSDQKAFVIASFLGGIGFFMMAFSKNIWFLLFCMAVLTIGELIRTPIALGFVSKLAPEHQRGQYMGASTLQFTIGRILAPLLVTLSNWFGPLVIFGIIFGVTILSILCYQKMFTIMERAKSVQA
ncbi:MFS transporter [Brevibacillus laterosporus]|uniref:MDR family MFS transporter n=1 Tax=Brevibacillus TaxID=55080 RepID=UPI000C768330|nr:MULTISPECIES: MFS transporter [Brevibacillus]AUM67077.1 MFS transporter [Brevibacillus laterosporus]MCR8963140.1 MFS transporter [Brevibacillus laterosporus]MCZ0835296.1 MFS transporter [Brevibacillus halotolerans]MDF9410270.1 MFS transporter [Brevibacillus laterosporus]